jgi:lipopolysaccharide export system permease protein
MSTPLATLLLALLAVPLSYSKPRQSRFYNFFIGILIYIF